MLINYSVCIVKLCDQVDTAVIIKCQTLCTPSSHPSFYNGLGSRLQNLFIHIRAGYKQLHACYSNILFQFHLTFYFRTNN